MNWTWDDVRDAASKLTKIASDEDESDTWGVEFRLQNLDYVLRSFGGGFPVGKPENPGEIRAGNLAALQFVADLVLKDRVHPYPSLGWNDGFAQGKVSMAFLPEWATPRLNAFQGLDYDVSPIPQGPAGSVTSFSATGVAMGGTLWAWWLSSSRPLLGSPKVVCARRLRRVGCCPCTLVS